MKSPEYNAESKTVPALTEVVTVANRRIPNVLTNEELAALYQVPNVSTTAGLRNRAMLQVMGDCALRSCEVLGLTTGDLVRGKGKLTHLRLETTKGSVPRTVPLTADAANYLGLWLEKRKEQGIGNGFVFCTISEGKRAHAGRNAQGEFAQGKVSEAVELQPGKELSSRYLRDLVKRTAAAAGIEKDVHPHLLRHTALTNVRRETGDIRLTQTLAGHARLSTTLIYDHVLEEELTAAMQAMPSLEANAGADDPQAAKLAALVAAGFTRAQAEALLAALPTE